ncbi:hypothetical protein Holit_02941 [Hollandina sp. SP2]
MNIPARGPCSKTSLPLRFLTSRACDEGSPRFHRVLKGRASTLDELFVHTVGEPYPAGRAKAAARNPQNAVLLEVLHEGPIISLGNLTEFRLKSGRVSTSTKPPP